MNDKQGKFTAEFDKIADSYYHQHQKNISISGESPEYFSEYKISDLAAFLNKKNISPNDILDFGCGIGNSIEFFRKYFPGSKLCCADVSLRSIEIAKKRFPGREDYIHVVDTIPLISESFDIVFTACVFHHIAHDQHEKWLSELKRITRKGGILVIFEHNPLNPLTVRAVNTCPIDINAQLIRAGGMKKSLLKTGWADIDIEYKLFFPSMLRVFRPLEKYMHWFFLGAQWRSISRK